MKYCRVVNDHALGYDLYVVQTDVLHDCAGLAGYLSVEHRTDRGCFLAIRGCLTVIVLECSSSNTPLNTYVTWWRCRPHRRSELCMVYEDEDSGRRRKAVGPVERELDQPLWSGRSTRELAMARGSKRDRWKERRRETNGEREIERDLREERSWETGRRSRARQQGDGERQRRATEKRWRERATEKRRRERATEETTVRDIDGERRRRGGESDERRERRATAERESDERRERQRRERRRKEETATEERGDSDGGDNDGEQE
ncbi:hypothetical protein DAPPUDRAFT_113350 [Daphnia pulex]|uniref:Uncharacterized protein n=1 Tax=Daphnia pulex TaxID=6669 RepID=E9HET0_DAPPU|nr:hypothetical protein DAPPUDRAFT_113350 [Daphnia pulex]|eukprot:EFX69723.1 hypothetical protein DAPPUDRAFT_113350 [Daphnia pulex]